jgi:hypothetical protein
MFKRLQIGLTSSFYRENAAMRRFVNSALGRIVRMLPPKEILDGYENSELIEAMFGMRAILRPRSARLRTGNPGRIS